MKIRQLAIAITFSLFSLNSYAASTPPRYVYSVSDAVVTGDFIASSTITKGYTNLGKTVYKPVVQKVEKALFIKISKKALGLTPYGIAALAAYEAYGWYMDDDGELMNSNSTEYDYSSNMSGLKGTCAYGYYTNSMTNGWYNVDFNTCVANVTAYFNTRTTLPYSFKNNTTEIIGTNTYEVLSYATELGGSKLRFIFSDPSQILQKNPVSVSDDDYWAAQVAYMNQTPDFSWADAFKNADGTINQEYFPDPEFDEMTTEDQVLLDLYASGLLQSTDPSADHYVTPTEYDRIKQMYDTQNLTDQQIADELNANLEQAITQEQYQTEQTAIEAREEVRKNAAAATLAGLDVGADELATSADTINQSFIDQLTLTNDLPDTNGFIDYFSFNSGSGCETVELPFNVVFPTTSQCEKLGSLKTMLGYFLFCLIGWNMINVVLKEAN